MKNGYTLEDIQKISEKQRKNKKYRGWFEIFNAGNVPYNIEMFNKMSGPSQPSTESEGQGEISSGEGPAPSSNGAGEGQAASSGPVGIGEQLDFDSLTGTYVSKQFPSVTYRIDRNPKTANRFIITEQDESGNKLNQDKFVSLKAVNQLLAHCTKKSEQLLESNLGVNMDYQFEYQDLPVIVYEGGSPSGYYSDYLGTWLPDQGEEVEKYVDYTLEVSEDDIIEALEDIIEVDDQHDDKYFEENVQELFTEHEQELKEYFRDRAIRVVQDLVDRGDYLFESANRGDYVFKDLREAQDVELKDFWEDADVPQEEEENSIDEDEPVSYSDMDFDTPELEDDQWDALDYLDQDESDDSDDWELVASKDVFDSDGFLTTYKWFKSTDPENPKHIFMFGVDQPDPDYADWQCDTFECAKEWFNSYKGFEEEDDSYQDPVELDQPSEPDEIDFDDMVTESKTYNEGAMSDLDIDIKELGGKDKLAAEIEKKIAALEAEMSFLIDMAPREIRQGGAFNSQQEIDQAREITERQLEKEKAKLAILRRKG